MEKKRGRPLKKAYSGTCLIQELLETVSAVYAEKQEIKATALALDLPPHKVKKLLITHGDIHYTETDQIIGMQQQGMHISEIAERIGMAEDSEGNWAFRRIEGLRCLLHRIWILRVRVESI